MLRFVVVLFASLLPVLAFAEIRVVDLAGREVVLDSPADKVILGEGRFMAVLGILGVKNPVSHVAAMMDEFRRFDPDSFARYRQAFPGIDEIPTFGQTSEDTVSVERAILANPDVAIFGLQGHGPGARSKHIIDQLTQAGIPVVFIDFRQQPLENTARSVEIFGKVLGMEKQAAAFVNFYESEVAKVTDRLQKSPPQHCPSVFLEMRVDTQQSCCITISRGMFADLVEAAGGCNVAEELLPGAVGQLNQEHVIATAPEVYIGSAIGSLRKGDAARSTHILLGPGVTNGIAQDSLEHALQREGFINLPATVSGQAHGIWHHFYNSPLNVYALQKIAQWLHPELFADLNPEQVLQQMLSLFEPVDLAGTYAVSYE